MTIRIWLNAKGEKALEAPVQGRADLLKVGERMLRVDAENGCKYVNLNGDPNDPSMVFPTVPREFIQQITYVEKYYTGFRTDGVYRYKGATARTDTQERHHGHANITIERWQTISISAGSIKTLRQIYSKVRSGELKPATDWEVSQTDLARREREAKTASEASGQAH
jgi:hypothetical protein